MNLEKLYEIVVCPYCKMDLGKDLHCKRCNVTYNIDNSLTALLSENESTKITSEENGKKKYQIDFYSKVGNYLSKMQKKIGNKEAFNYLNFGYKVNNNKQYASIELPEYYLNKNSVKLTLEVIGEVDLSGKRVLEIGCGRGGNINTMNEFYNPELTVGVDITERSIRYSIENLNSDNSCFLVGDAENLPLKSYYFDIVFNLESSHAYPSKNKFYHEVFRVLKPGGIFMYSDLLPHEDFILGQDYLTNLGFEIVRDQDITSNILLSCDDSSKVKREAFNSIKDPKHIKFLEDFVASPGSDVYKFMKSGDSIYKILTLMK